MGKRTLVPANPDLVTMEDLVHLISVLRAGNQYGNQHVAEKMLQRLREGGRPLSWYSLSTLEKQLIDWYRSRYQSV